MTGSQVFPSMTPEQEAQVQAEARAFSRRSLHYLAKEVLGYNRLTDTYHRQMAEDISSSAHNKKLLLHPRGHFKSTIGTEAYAIFKLLRNPNERILITNAKLGNSRKFLAAIAHHFHANPRFRWIWRAWWLGQYTSPYHKEVMGDKLDWVARDVMDEFTLMRPYEGREASVTTGAVDASLVSQHYSTIIADDLINRDYVSTMDMVEKSILYFKDLLDLLDPGGELLIIGTRWAHNDLYRWLIDTFAPVADIRAPASYLPPELMAKARVGGRKDWIISIQPAIQDDGSTVFPEEFDRRVLDDLLQSKGPYEFGSQYLLNPIPKEGQKFHEDWFNRFDIEPDASRMTICMTVDPAVSIAEGADYSAILVCGYDNRNRMYLLDGVNERFTPDELVDVVFNMAKKWDRKGRFLLPVGFESIGFQQIYIYNLERKMREDNFFFAIEPISRRRASKQERILRLVPRIKNGFFLPRLMPRTSLTGREPEYDLAQRLVWELTQFPLAGRDDLADALADQLELAQAQGLPTEATVEEYDPTEEFLKRGRKFTHHSILEDRGKIARRKLHYVDDAVR